MGDLAEIQFNMTPADALDPKALRYSTSDAISIVQKVENPRKGLCDELNESLDRIRQRQLDRNKDGWDQVDEDDNEVVWENLRTVTQPTNSDAELAEVRKEMRRLRAQLAEDREARRKWRRPLPPTKLSWAF